ncbi:MAG: GDP-fucose synthetase [Euryarchaeota archaeon]|jgi:GDP-L-fucose synthase|nr:GDP-fucose synthetase [Euryarchaeota archaeon]MBF14486.1 GDP-fucose synthetase [Euryarchaeota archaeon]|tara:strand:+ start:841 stop:1761 length:921 start_codon:yes stop_codon:yes gene_type:complete
MATVLVTGASGMLGQHLVPMLEKKGYLILAPSQDEIDLTDAAAISSFIGSNSIDVVVHCAAYVAGIASSTTKKHHSFDANVSMGMNLIRSCLEHGITKLLNVGSATVYPSDAPQPLSESSLGQGAFEGPIEGYALSKYVVYRACAMANEQHNTSFKTILPCNLFGPYDNFSLETGHMLPAILHRMHQAKEQQNAPIVIWGDGSAKREFLYASDLADFICFSLDNFESLPEVMNVGSGVEVSVNEMHQHMAKIIGYSGELQHDLDKPVGRLRRYLDLQHQQRLGWSPKTPFEEALAITYDYLRRTLE